jgi:CubicO group peptidase (beta-lactamase class C family)
MADDTITVRELLSHTAGVDNPAPDRLYGETAQDLATVMGPVIGCTGPRGVAEASNGGIVVLGQLVTDVTGQPYADAATRLVLEPLQLSDSSFPARVTDIPDGAVTGYNLTLEGMFRPFPPRVPTLAAVAGLWSTGADLVRLGLGWSALLPGSLAHEALTPQAPQTGLGWLLSPDGEVAMIAGGGHDAVAYLGVRIRDGRTHVVLTSRMMPVNTIAERLLRT